jgi:hypothetical protein
VLIWGITKKGDDMRKRRLFKRLARQKIMLLVIAASLFCMAIYAENVYAADISVKVIENGILDKNLVMQFQAEEVFTEKVIKFLTRGFTVKIEYTIELWRSRKWWFDRLDTQHSVRYQIDFEPLEKRYTCLISEQGKAITSKLEQQLANIIQYATRPELPLTIGPVAELDRESNYYYNIIISVATLTAENINDLRRWIKFGEKEKETSTITRTSFELAKDAISARHRKRVSMRSDMFRLQNLPKFDS